MLCRNAAYQVSCGRSPDTLEHKLIPNEESPRVACCELVFLESRISSFKNSGESIDGLELVSQLGNTGKGLGSCFVETNESRLVDTVSRDSLKFSESVSGELGESIDEVSSGICIIIDNDASRPGIGA